MHISFIMRSFYVHILVVLLLSLAGPTFANESEENIVHIVYTKAEEFKKSEPSTSQMLTELYLALDIVRLGKLDGHKVEVYRSHNAHASREFLYSDFFDRLVLLQLGEFPLKIDFDAFLGQLNEGYRFAGVPREELVGLNFYWQFYGHNLPTIYIPVKTKLFNQVFENQRLPTKLEAEAELFNESQELIPIARKGGYRDFRVDLAIMKTPSQFSNQLNRAFDRYSRAQIYLLAARDIIEDLFGPKITERIYKQARTVVKNLEAYDDAFKYLIDNYLARTSPVVAASGSSGCDQNLSSAKKTSLKN